MKSAENGPPPNALKTSPGVRDLALNRMCHSLGSADNSKRFKAFPEAYCHSFGLTREETHAVTDLDIPRLLTLGARLECLALLTAVFDIDVLELGAQQSGVTPQQFVELHGTNPKPAH